MTRHSQINLSLPRKPGEPFNPFGLFNGIFVPEAICKYRALSLGAKMVYGRLCRYAGRDGAVYPAMSTLGSELGIGKTQARQYVQELERQCFIAVDRNNRHFGPHGAGGSNRYVFLWHRAFDGERGSIRKIPPVRKTGGVPLQETGPLPLRKTGHEENHHQDREMKDRSVFSAPTAAVLKRECTLPVDGHPESGKGSSPWDELRSEYKKATGGIEISHQDESWLKEQMELRSVSPGALLELLRQNQLSRFHQPMAGLKWLVKKFFSKTRTAGEQDAVSAFPAIDCLSPRDNPRCEKCTNSGRILERIEGQRPTMTDKYCDCPMGRDLEAAERHVQAKMTAKA